MEKKETVFETIKTRRSTRSYSDREVSKEDLDMVLEAGRFAPSGGNNQTTHLLVITSQEIKEKIAKLAEKLFSGMEVMPDTYKSMASAIHRYSSLQPTRRLTAIISLTAAVCLRT